MINFVISYSQNVIIKTSAFTGPSSSSNTSSSSSSSGASRMVALQQGEVVLDIQFQSQMLTDSDTDGDAHNRAIRSSPSPQTGTKSVPHSQDQPLGIGVLTTHRVLVFVVQDPSSSPLVVTNSHTHSACSGAEATQSRGNQTPLHVQY